MERGLGRRIVEHLVEEGVDVLVFEGDLAGKHLVQDDADGVEVGAAVHGLVADLLGGKELRRPHDGGVLLDGLVLGAADAEVHHLHPVVLEEEDILGLEVAVDDPHPVRGLQPQERLAGDLQAAPDREDPLAHEDVLDRPSDHVLHGDEFLAADLAQVVHPAHVLVGDLAGEEDLLPQALDVDVILGAAQHLEGDGGVQLEVVGQVDHPHAAEADELLDPVAVPKDISGMMDLTLADHARRSCRPRVEARLNLRIHEKDSTTPPGLPRGPALGTWWTGRQAVAGPANASWSLAMVKLKGRRQSCQS